MVYKAEVIKHLHWILNTLTPTVRCPDGSEVLLAQTPAEARKQAAREYYRVSRAQPL